MSNLSPEAGAGDGQDLGVVGEAIEMTEGKTITNGKQPTQPLTRKKGGLRRAVFCHLAQE
jgi:hypothetical protein